jgi:hypothetical protein
MPKSANKHGHARPPRYTTYSTRQHGHRDEDVPTSRRKHVEKEYLMNMCAHTKVRHAQNIQLCSTGPWQGVRGTPFVICWNISSALIRSLHTLHRRLPCSLPLRGGVRGPTFGNNFYDRHRGNPVWNLNGEGLDKSDGHWQTLVQEVFQRPLISRESGYWLSVHDGSGRLCFVYRSLYLFMFPEQSMFLPY